MSRTSGVTPPEYDEQTYEVVRLNWAGLGVVKVEERDRCVPLTRVGEDIRVRWHYGAWGKVTGERIDPTSASTLALDQALGCAQARRCSGCSLRHMSVEEQRQAQEESHLGAITRLGERDTSKVDVVWLQGVPRDGYRVRVTAQLRVIDEERSRWGLALRARWGAPVDLALCPNHPQILRDLVTCVGTWLNEHAQALLPAQGEGSPSQSSSQHQSRNRSRFTLSRISIQAGGGLPRWVTLHLEDPRKEGGLKRHIIERRLSQGSLIWDQLPIDILYQGLNQVWARSTSESAERSDQYDEPNDPKSVSKALAIFGVVGLRDQAKSSLGPHRLMGPQDHRWACARGYEFVAYPPAWLPQTPSSLESVREGVARCIWGAPAQGPCADDRDDRDELVVEVGCGVGLIGVALLAAHPHLRWIGIDIVPESAHCAAESAMLNQVDQRSRWIAEDGRRALADLDVTPDILIIHAMRRPLSGILQLAAHLEIKRVCYLAPSAPSLGRDLAEAPIYHLDHIYFLDQMPGTATLMTIAQLSLTST